MPYSGLKDHVVIAGGGRVGQHIAQALTQIDFPFVIVELNHQRMLECKNAKFPVIYGDMSQPTVLEASMILKSRLLLITIPSVVRAQSIVKQAHRLKPELHIIARAEGVVGVVHEKVFHPNPKADYSCQEGDMVAVVGNQQEPNEFKKLAGVFQNM